MEPLTSLVNEMMRPFLGERNRTYHRTDESHYVYRLHPDGKGATVASTVQGDYGYQHTKRGDPQAASGTMAGIFAGELDENGKVTRGGYQKWVSEGGKERLEMRGGEDPMIFASKVGVRKPSLLTDKPFEQSRVITKELPVDIDQVVNTMLLKEGFEQDPFKGESETQRQERVKAIHG